ncbi:MAG TPA: ABC transporter permease [Elusimicrobiota bacterium]|nr:ABC transporter permease [Elusimicrobiota bacterium]
MTYTNRLHVTPQHFWNLVKELTRCEFKLRDQSTLLGFLWTLLHPTLMFVVLYALFVKWMGNHVPSFPMYLLVGVVQWNYFVKGTTGGMTSLLQKSGLISNFIFPRSALVISSVFTNLLIHLLELGVMIPFLFAFGDAPSLKWFLLPGLVLLETVMILGASFLLARLAVDYKDMVRIWEIVTMTGFFVTPIFFPVEIVAPDRRQILLLNPMAQVIAETRKFMVYDQWPSPRVLGILLLFSLALAWFGYRFFKKGEPHFAEKFP